MFNIKHVKTIVVATVVVSALAAIYGWKLVKENCTSTVAGIEMTQTDRDEIMGDDDLYMNIKPCYNYNGMPYNTPVSFSTYRTYDGGVSIPLHTRQRVTGDNNGTLSVVLLIVTGIVFVGGLIYLFIEIKRS